MKNGSELLAPHPLSTNTDKQGKVKISQRSSLQSI